MGRIHPSEGKSTESAESARASGGDGLPSTWTVWKKSSMGFQGTDGFSVYDSDGRLAFRVDNYSRRRKCFAGELLLMDGDGRAILSLRPQLMSMHDQWNGYKAEDGFAKKPKPQQLFAMRRCAVLQSGDAAEVFMGWPDGHQKALPPKPSFRVEGCFWRRSCKILGRDGEEAARICRKKAAATAVGGSSATTTTTAAAAALLGDDVFSLVVQPGVDCRLIMAFVVVMDRICRKKPSGAPVLMCS